MPYFVYMLCCADNTLYTGWTTNLEKRLQVHNAGNGSRYTRSRRPVQLLHYWEFETKQQAMQREWQIKQLTRSKKLALIQH